MIAVDSDKVKIAKFIEANFKLFDKPSNNYIPIANMGVELSRMNDDELKKSKEALLEKFDTE